MEEHNTSFGALLTAVALLGLAGCASGPGRDPYELDEADKQAYRIDCRRYCQAEAVCLSAPADSACDRWCAGVKSKGALQAAFVDGRYDCVSGLGPGCVQARLDVCFAQALAACLPADGLLGFASAWCTRWLECHGSAIEPFLQRCLDDFAAAPDHAWFDCFSSPALERLGQCLAEASCEQITGLPVLTWCAGVYL